MCKPHEINVWKSSISFFDTEAVNESVLLRKFKNGRTLWIFYSLYTNFLSGSTFVTSESVDTDSWWHYWRSQREGLPFYSLIIFKMKWLLNSRDKWCWLYRWDHLISFHLWLLSVLKSSRGSLVSSCMNFLIYFIALMDHLTTTADSKYFVHPDVISYMVSTQFWNLKSPLADKAAACQLIGYPIEPVSSHNGPFGDGS